MTAVELRDARGVALTPHQFPLFNCQTANASPPDLSGRGRRPSCRFPFSVPQREGDGAPGGAGGVRDPPWGNLGSANPAPGRSPRATGRRCDLHPETHAQYAVRAKGSGYVGCAFRRSTAAISVLGTALRLWFPAAVSQLLA